ncbi:MAG: OmpA family protein [Acidobacteriia bacterium]|nr:OmpA family protein [Terriglobia bacterium]
MRKRTTTVVALLAIGVLAVSVGCVTKKVYRKDQEQTDTRMKGVESGVEQNERRVGDLRKETDTRISEVKGTAEKAVEIGSAAMNKAQDAEKLARGKVLWTVTLSDDRVKFSFDQDAVPSEAAMDLDDLSAKVKSMDKTVYLEIEGHTDNIGSDDYNMQLGEKRAKAVMTYLNEKDGLPLHAMSVISYGKSKPVADNKTKQGRAQNRRVVIRVLE